MTKLVWNTYIERNGKICAYNIFNNTTFCESLTKAIKQVKKSRTYLAKHVAFTDRQLKSRLAKYKKDFYETVRQALLYCFWSKCEYEMVLTDWPTCASVMNLARAIESADNQYRTCVDLDVSRKVSVYDQVMLNWDIFCDYIWNKCINK